MITPLLPVSAFAGNLPAYDNNNETISNLPDLGFFMEPQTSSNLVSQICVNGFELPIAGEKSGNYQNLSVPEGSHYSITTKSWFCDSTNSWIDADTLFIEGYFYSCAAEVTLESGYKFADAVEFFANGSKDKVDMSWKNDSTGVARVVVNSVKSEKISNTRTVELSASPDSIGTVAGAGVYAVNTEVTVSTSSTDENGGFSVTVNSSTWIPSQDGGKITVRVQTPETDTYSIMNESSEINFYAHDWQFIKFGGKPVPGKTPGESGYIRFYVNYKCTCEHPGEYEEHDGGHWAVFETTEENSISYYSDARPTCTENGEFLYNFVFDGLDGQADERGIVTKDPSLGHDWGEIEYVWSKDGDTWKCTATRTCARNSEHIETETVTARSEVTKQATLTEEGERVYSADFVNSDFETQTKNETVPKLTETAIPITTPDTGEKEGGDNDFAVLSPQTGYESNPTPWGVLLILLCCLAIIVFSCLKTRRAFFIIKKSFSDTDK
ncbi:MAG: hypothetical protein IJU01_05320 [Lachnospiraceae bacterium]|nr:hypothetical protein [Lachnospiraceae bacterium]